MQIEQAEHSMIRTIRVEKSGDGVSIAEWEDLKGMSRSDWTGEKASEKNEADYIVATRSERS